jgi:hypothetical protein
VIALVAVLVAACLPAPAGPGVGVADPFRPPAAEATQLNADAKVVYRQGKWDDARAKYRAALEADPDFLAPRLNIACSFVRQERFDEAVAEVRGLLDRAYMPWSREVLEAADLGALKVQPQMAEVKRALASAAQAWGAGLEDAVIFVGRLREPLHIPLDQRGSFILNPHQEVFAYLPETGRFRQLTAEDGHVLAVIRSPDRRRIVYVTAQKLIRGDKDALDGVAVRELTLATMSLSPPASFPGPVVDLRVHRTPHGFVFAVEGVNDYRWLSLVNGTWVPSQPAARTPAVGWLRPFGAPFVWSQSSGGPCGVVARDSPGKGAVHRVIEVTAHGRTRTIGERFGAGLDGLPLP